MSNLDNKTIRELLKLQVSVIDELRKRNVVRTGNNPLGDYTEWLVAKALGLNLVKNAMAGYDATSEDGVKIQIKGRRITKRNLSAYSYALLFFATDFKLGFYYPRKAPSERMVGRKNRNWKITFRRNVSCDATII